MAQRTEPAEYAGLAEATSMPSTRILVANCYQESSLELGELDELLDHLRFFLSHADTELETLSALETIVVCLTQRLRRTEDVADLDELIDTMTRFIELKPECRCHSAQHLAVLGLALLDRFNLRTNVEDLDASIAVFRRAYGLAPDEYFHVDLLLHALHTRFWHLEERRDADEVLELTDRLLAFEDAPNRADSIALQQRFSFYRFNDSKDVDDLDTSLGRSRTVLTAGDSDTSLLSAPMLAFTLFERFMLYHEVSDIDLAISLLTEELERDPPPNPTSNKATNLQGLAMCYEMRFMTTGRSSDIDEAIMLLNRAIELDTPAEDRSVPGALHLQLAHCYMLRFDRGILPGSAVDIDNATKVLRDLRQSYHVDPPPEWYLCYGQCLMAQFARFDDGAIRHEMISVLEEGARRIPTDRVRARETIFRDLARARCQALHHDEAGLPFHLYQSRLQEVLSAYAHAADVARTPSLELFTTGEFSSHYDACHRFIFTLEQAKAFFDVDIVKDMHSRILDGLPENIWLGHTLSRRYEEVSKLQAAVSASVATALLLEDKGAALEWFEQGRAVVWSQIQDLRSPLDDLREKHSDLAGRLEKLSSELEDAGRRAPLPSLGASDMLAFGHAAPIEEQAVTGRRLARKHKELLEQIRTLNGFQSFLRPKRVEALLKAAETRAVACINVHGPRCDALILFNSDLHHVRLPRLTPAKIGEWYARLTRYLQQERARAIDDHRKSKAVHHRQRLEDIREVLREMWVCVVWPILEVYLDNLDEGRAHITWCTTGQLAFLPLHAAGPHDGESVNALDLVVSSYAPNLSSLLPLTTEPQPAEPSSILVVAQPSARNVTPLPGTVEESVKVAANFSDDSAQVLLGKDGTVEAVLDSMKKHPYIHFACHGKQDADPTKSAFFLHDGELTLNALMAHKSSNARLAFLSACETATGDAKVPNEAVHLAAGMLAVGYKSVVATMWSIGDTEAPRVADEFYKALLADPERNVAFALHTAVQKLREHVGVDQFVKWMPFIHLGL